MGLLAGSRMRRLTLIICLGLVLSSQPCSAVGEDNPLFDRYGNISLEAEKARLDNYSIQLKSSPTSRGLIVVYSGGSWNSSYVKRRAKRAIKYLVEKRGISVDRLKWRHDAHCATGSVLLYLFYPNEVDPPRDSKCMNA